MSVLRSLFLFAGLPGVLLSFALFLEDAPSSDPSCPPVSSPWNWWETYSWMESEDHRKELLDADNKTFFDAVRAKEQIAEDLLDNRLRFPEAVAQFRAVDANNPPHLRSSTFFSVCLVPAASVEERWANLLLSWAQKMARNRLDKEALLARLATARDNYLRQVSAPSPSNLPE